MAQRLVMAELLVRFQHQLRAKFDTFNKDQRLRDAKIGKEKKQKVLEAIWDKFTADEEFYRINTNDFKTQFSRIAQSSIMKLNEVSMSKLFDLMIMGKVSIVITTPVINCTCIAHPARPMRLEVINWTPFIKH